MSEQLPGLETPPEQTLTPRQRFALAYIQATPPVTSDELGAALHERRLQETGRGHRAETRCRFCQSEGADMGRALQRKELVRRTRGGWVPADWLAPKRDGYDPATAEIPY